MTAYFTAITSPTPTSTPTPPPPTLTPTVTVIPSPSPTALRAYQLAIPKGDPPIIDGQMDEGEWTTAAVERLGDGSELYLLHADGILYVGIRGSTPEMIVSNVLMASSSTIRIMHTSAALGTAVYELTEGQWTLTQEFRWRCRSTRQNEAAQAERADFLADEGWVSTNSRIGTVNELEFHIIMPDSPFSLAVNILRSSEPNLKIPFPVDLTDGVTMPTPGGLPDVLPFTPEAWALVQIL